MVRNSKTKTDAVEVMNRLAQFFGQVECALTHSNPYELLVATILSAQCTDERVNKVTPALFERYATPEALAVANQLEVEDLIRSTGFFRAKSNNLIQMASAVCSRFGGDIPNSMEDLQSLPGVGRKTANVVLSVAFKLPGLPVDTHVSRISRRLGLTYQEDPVKIEFDLCRLISPKDWGDFSLLLILHGRATCKARKPQCGGCVLLDICPSAEV